MAHLIRPIREQPISVAIDELDRAIGFLVERSRAAATSLARLDVGAWGIEAKRLPVDLSGAPDVIEKQREALTEVINMAATGARLLDVLRWARSENSAAYVVVCHPTTSSTGSERDETDLILRIGARRLKIEVCDVVSTNPASNGKEKRTLEALGCDDAVPVDDAEYVIAASPSGPAVSSIPDESGVDFTTATRSSRRLNRARRCSGFDLPARRQVRPRPVPQPRTSTPKAAVHGYTESGD